MQCKKISGFSDEIASDILTQFKVLNRLGISFFEPRGINGKNISSLNDDDVNELKEEMNEHGIKASSIGSPIGKIKLTDDFDEHFELFKRTVKIAKMLETKYIRIFSFYHNGGEWSIDERAEVLRRLRTMISYAKENNIVLLHENEKDIYGDIAERCEDLMKELYCENFKAVFDPANFVQCGTDTRLAYEKLKQYVEYMHIKDALSESNRVVPAGIGDGNLEFIVTDFIKNCGGFLSLEPHLGAFEGLADLELDDSMLSLPQGGEGTFTVAFNALKKIIEKI
jgi:sugar phosphate isomerase/epimerase